MSKLILLSIITSSFLCILVSSLVKETDPPYQLNKELVESLHKVDFKVQEKIDLIKKNEKKMKEIRKGAIFRGLSIPETLKRSAKYILLENEKTKIKNNLNLEENNLTDSIEMAKRKKGTIQ